MIKPINVTANPVKRSKAKTAFVSISGFSRLPTASAQLIKCSQEERQIQLQIIMAARRNQFFLSSFFVTRYIVETSISGSNTMVKTISKVVNLV